MKRIKSVDIFRGMCIFYMTVGHQMEWWLNGANYWLYEIIWDFGAPIGGGGFLLVSGMSAAISYRSRMLKSEQNPGFSKESIRNEYLIRALLILLISFTWNTSAALLGLLESGITGIWLWFVIQTISISLILAWPFLKTSRTLRLVLGFSIMIANEFIIILLEPFKEQFNVFGILYHFLYNEPKQNVILGYFPYLLIGTAIGDLFYELFSIEDPVEQKLLLKKKVFIPFTLGGIFFTIFGIMLFFPDFTRKETFASHLFIFGIELIVIAFLTWLKDYKNYKAKKSYRLLFFYSYYSFIIFFAHNLLFFLFPGMLDVVTIWFFLIPTTILWTLLWRFIYNKYKESFSLKVKINNVAVFLSKRIEIKRTIN